MRTLVLSVDTHSTALAVYPYTVEHENPRLDVQRALNNAYEEWLERPDGEVVATAAPTWFSATQIPSEILQKHGILSCTPAHLGYDAELVVTHEDFRLAGDA